MTVTGYVTDPAVQCAGKRTFASKRDAKTAARRAETSGQRRPGRLESYRCPHCGLYHNGHRPKAGA